MSNDWKGFGGVGLTIVSLFLPFAFPNMPVFVAYIGVCIGLILIVLEWAPRALTTLHIPDITLGKSYISLDAAAVDAYTRLRAADSVIAYFADDEGRAGTDRRLNTVISHLIDANGDYLPVYGKYSLSTEWEIIKSDDAAHGQFLNSAKEFVRKGNTWHSLRVERRAWNKRVRLYVERGPKASDPI